MLELNATLIGQLLTFLLLVLFTLKYVWPPIIAAIQAREKVIADGLEAALVAQRELQQAEVKAAEIVQIAKQDATLIVDAAHKRTAQMVDEAKETARIEGNRLLKNAEEEFTREVSQTKEALRQQLASLSVAGANKLINANLDPAKQTALLEEFLTEL